MNQSTHENFTRDEASPPGSNRTFGLVMAGALALLALINGWHSGRLWPWELILAALFLSAALFRPALLHPLNRLWMQLGLLLHKIVNPIVMGLVFLRHGGRPGSRCGCGKDLLRLKREPDADSYWIARPPGPLRKP